MTNASFVTIHGIDGTGKTSASRNVAQALSRHNIPTINYDDITAEVVADRSQSDIALAKKLSQSALITHYLESGHSIVRDRWLIDIHADRGFAGNTIAVPSGILTPDYSFVLTCEDSVRMQRVLARGNPTEQDLIPNVEGTRAHYFEQYLLRRIGEFAHRALTIDTTELGQDEVAETITNHLLLVP